MGKPLNPFSEQGRVMNLIVGQALPGGWCTDLYPFFCQIESTIRDFVWLWTDIEVSGSHPRSDGSDTIWISGEDLFEFVATRQQIIWSVFSAIPANRCNEARGLDCNPYADGNPSFWAGSPVPQHPLASFEIVCWDASEILLIGADCAIQQAFRTVYPSATSLDVWSTDAMSREP